MQSMAFFSVGTGNTMGKCRASKLPHKVVTLEIISPMDEVHYDVASSLKGHTERDTRAVKLVETYMKS